MTAGYWTEAENIAVILLYFAMLGRAKSGVAYSKAGMIRGAQGEAEIPDTGYTIAYGPLADRSKGSIEFKLMNCTACHASLLCGGDWDSAPEAIGATMHNRGYRAMPNYQADLKAAMSKMLAGEL